LPSKPTAPWQPPTGIDWICVSPKAGTELKQRSGDELKPVFPQPVAEPEHYADLIFRYFYSTFSPWTTRNCRATHDWQSSIVSPIHNGG